MRILIFSLLILLAESGFCSEVTITSNHPDYAGQKLVFYYHDDPITKKNIPVFSLNFDEAGKATVRADIKKASCFYIDFGIYRGKVFIAPGKNIDLKMPPLREKSFADQKNPYFEPVTFWFNTTIEDNLNNQISDFTIFLNGYTDRYFEQLYFQRSKTIYDSLIYKLEENFSAINSQVFNDYKNLAIKVLQADVFRLRTDEYTSELSNFSSDTWQNPAFEDVLEKAFNNQLSSTAKSVNGSDIKKAVNSSDLNYLETWVNAQYKISGEMGQLALLKLLYDAYFSGEFSKSAIEKMVHSTNFSNNKNAAISKTSDNIYSKFTFLKNGTFAPEICLKNLKGATACTGNNNNKFKYLLFVDIEMIVCREHLKYLDAINQRFQEYLEICVVFRNSDTETIEKFIEENPVPGNLLLDVSGEYTKLYGIRSFPQCFLLDENHKIKLDEVKSPLDGFELQFGTLLRGELIEQQRNQSR